MFILPSPTLDNSRYVSWKKKSAVVTAAYALALDFDLTGWAPLWYLVEEKLIVSGLPIKLVKGYG
jgi:hypothetical protein